MKFNTVVLAAVYLGLSTVFADNQIEQVSDSSHFSLAFYSPELTGQARCNSKRASHGEASKALTFGCASIVS